MQLSLSEQPLFVLCMARSGSTLMRYILDTHPAVCCPPELHIVGVMSNLKGVYQNTINFPAGYDQQQCDMLVAGRIREVVESIVYDVLASKPGDNANKMWCDKSIYTVQFVETALEIYPGARFISLYRNCLDQVASARETLSIDPSGREFGFAPYIAGGQNQPVSGLVNYWLSMTESILQAEQQLGDKCHRVQYESVATDSQATLENLFAFLGLDWNEGLTEQIFTASHRGGRGDHKIQSTSSIKDASVGKDHGIDIKMIDKPVIEKINSLHRALGYEEIVRPKGWFG